VLLFLIFYPVTPSVLEPVQIGHSKDMTYSVLIEGGKFCFEMPGNASVCGIYSRNAVSH
jgi:hypothetical protein